MTPAEVLEVMDGTASALTIMRAKPEGVELLREARAAIVAMAAVLQEAVDADGGTFYADDDDDVGSRACCRVLSYKEHASDCWVAKAQRLLSGAGHE